MLTKELIKEKFYEKHPDFNLNNKTRSLFDIYVLEGKEGELSFYGVTTNLSKSSRGLNEAQIKELNEKAAKGENVLFAASAMFENNKRIITCVGDFYEKGKLNPTVEEFASYIEKKFEKTKQTPGLSKNNYTEVFKINKDGELDEKVFNMRFQIDNFSKVTDDAKKYRCFINNAESYDRGKGIYKYILTTYLPNLCSSRNISTIVLNAVAHETNSAEKGGQIKLEEMYKNCGYTNVKKCERKDFPGVLEKDFEEGHPVYSAFVQTLDYGLEL